jgi:hypothetical protein
MHNSNADKLYCDRISIATEAKLKTVSKKYFEIRMLLLWLLNQSVNLATASIVALFFGDKINRGIDAVSVLFSDQQADRILNLDVETVRNRHRD